MAVHHHTIAAVSPLVGLMWSHAATEGGMSKTTRAIAHEHRAQDVL